MEEKTQQVVALANELLAQLGYQPEVSSEIREVTRQDQTQQYCYLLLKGENLQDLVGFHGKIMDSLQIILNLLAQKTIKDFNLPVIVEVNDYRERREKYLESYALRAAEEAKAAGQDVELPPMKPSERRIVHLVLEKEGVKTESIGEGEQRRVVIKAN